MKDNCSRWNYQEWSKRADELGMGYCGPNRAVKEEQQVQRKQKTWSNSCSPLRRRWRLALHQQKAMPANRCEQHAPERHHRCWSTNGLHQRGIPGKTNYGDTHTDDSGKAMMEPPAG